MLKNTFIHIPGIGKKMEKSFWFEGILCWDDVYDAGLIKIMTIKRSNLIKKHISVSEEKLLNSEANYFERRMKW